MARGSTPLRFLLLSLLVPASAEAYTRDLAGRPGESGPATVLSTDCALQEYNFCSIWAWIYDDAPGAVWGTVFDPNDCAGGCLTGGAVSEVLLYSRCERVSAEMGGVRIGAVDAQGCLTTLLYDTGPLALTHCLPGDRWTRVPIPPDRARLLGNPFAVQVVWGPQGEVKFASDNALANLFCLRGYLGTFPGCNTTFPSCNGWTMAPSASYIYVTDWNGDTLLDDLCAQYGAPYALAFPYVAGYGYLNNNLAMSVGLDCHGPFPVEGATWGRIRALFD